jgi:hypothetical protein
LLASHRQSTAVPQTTVATEIHQTLDVHRHFPTQIAFDGDLRKLAANAFHFRLGQVPDPGFRGYPCSFTYLESAGPADAIYVRQAPSHLLNSCRLRAALVSGALYRI